MKKSYVSLLITLIFLLLCVICVASCNPTNKVKKNFIGVWDVKQILAEDETTVVIAFGEIAPLLTMKMSIQFNENDTFVIHYYVNGEEGEHYPQTGTFTVDGDTLVMSNGQIASIKDDKLIVQMEDGSSCRCTRIYQPS